MVTAHECGAVAKSKDAAFSSERLADQEGLRGGVVENGGVELEEFHVGDPRADPVRHRHTVAGGDVRVRGVKIDLSCAARRENHRARCDGLHFAGFLVEDVGTKDRVGAAVLRRREQVHSHVIGQKRDAVAVAPNGFQ